MDNSDGQGTGAVPLAAETAHTEESKPKKRTGRPRTHPLDCHCSRHNPNKIKKQAVAEQPQPGSRKTYNWSARAGWGIMATPKIPATDALQEEVFDPVTGKPVTEERVRGARHRVAQWLNYKLLEPGVPQTEVAKRIGCSCSVLKKDLMIARKQGWLTYEDQLLRMEHEIVPKVVDNLNHFLDAKDKAVTIEAAKGTIFKSYQQAMGIQDQPQTVLALRIESPPDGGVNIVGGTIVGRPKTVE